MTCDYTRSGWACQPVVAKVLQPRNNTYMALEATIAYDDAEDGSAALGATLLMRCCSVLRARTHARHARTDTHTQTHSMLVLAWQ